MTDPLSLKIITSINDIDAGSWDTCAGDDNPFCRHAFLSALEDSGSVSARTGWQPQHVVLRQGAQVIGCAPLYLKSHSYGEYVFDWAWADAYQRAGGAYYPKLQCSVPFTPVTGPRLMIHPEVADPEATRLALARGMIEIAERSGVSSLHVTFPTEAEWHTLGAAGMMQRLGHQYHWQNRGYTSFDDFLAALSSRKRKDLRKEREKAQSQGVRFSTVSGDGLTPRHWQAFYRFYLDTVDRKWGGAYLTEEFYQLLGQRLAERVVMVVGEEEESGEIVCAALNLRGHDTLYGRTWGCLGGAEGRYRFLHFEACYYQAIDYAIAHGLAWVEAGAQGEHKVQRGYLPRATYSAHWIADPRLATPIARFLEREREAVARDIVEMAKEGPFRVETTPPE